jgi:hypothetical protein
VADPGSASVIVMTGVGISYREPDTGFTARVITLLRGPIKEGDMQQLGVRNVNSLKTLKFFDL